MTKSMLVSENLCAFTKSTDEINPKITLMLAIGTFSPDVAIYIDNADCWLSKIGDMQCLVKHSDGCTLVVHAPSETKITECFDALERLSKAL